LFLPPFSYSICVLFFIIAAPPSPATPSSTLTSTATPASAFEIAPVKPEKKGRARRAGKEQKAEDNSNTPESSPVGPTTTTIAERRNVTAKDVSIRTSMDTTHAVTDNSAADVSDEVSPLQQQRSDRTHKSAPELTIATPVLAPTIATTATSAPPSDDNTIVEDEQSSEIALEVSADEVIAKPSVISSTDPPVVDSLPSPPLSHLTTTTVGDVLPSHREDADTPVSMHSDSGDENLLREAAHISESEMALEEPYAVPDPIFALNTTTAGAISVSSSSSHGSFRNSIPGRRSITISTDLYTDNGPSPLYSPYATSLYPGTTSLYSSSSYVNSAYTSPFYSNNVTPSGQKPSFFSELNENYDVLVTKEEEEEEEVNENDSSAVINDVNSSAVESEEVSEPSSMVLPVPSDLHETSAANDKATPFTLEVEDTQANTAPAITVVSTPVVTDRVVHSFGSGGFKIGIVNQSAIANHGTGSGGSSGGVSSPKIKDTTAVNDDGDNFAVPSVPVALTMAAPPSMNSTAAAVVTPTFAVSFNALKEKSAIAVAKSNDIPVSSVAMGAASTSTIAPLPVDAHRETILSHVRQNSVTIINGMTGCGKSTRIPIMLWEDSLATVGSKNNNQGDSKGCSDGSNGATTDEAMIHSATAASTAAPLVASPSTITTSSAPPVLPSEAFIMVSQPRRIAATALKNRLFTHYGDTVGLRLGHGMREETSNTRIWFVTTGYLVRLLAHKMHTFQHYTHLVIDEIHERSLDCDILCYLAKKLVYTYPHIRIVLMSATAHSAMFQSYFNTPHEPIFVGVRRYHLSEYFLENMHRLLPPSTHRTLNRLIESSNNITMDTVYNVVHDMLVKDQLFIAHALAKSIAKPGGAVLIFVSGMSDITELMEIFSNSSSNNSSSKKGAFLSTICFIINSATLCVPECGLYIIQKSEIKTVHKRHTLYYPLLSDSPKTVVLAVHSDIPHETQLLAFAPTPADQIKIVIATNAAESSVTIPDVDNVICCGTSKVLRYSERMHTTMLVNTW